MVTTSDAKTGKQVFGFFGLSTDTKPTDTYEGQIIENGSTFYEINTGTVYMFDEENQAWHAQ